MDKNSPLTGKAAQTKERILETALELFAKKGYAETTLRTIATEAKVSLGLTYRYFSSKDDLVLALYERLSADCAARAKSIDRGSLGVRFEGTLLMCLDQLQPHRATLESLFSVGLSASSEVAVLGEKSAAVRVRMLEVYAEVISGSTDRFRPAQAENIKTLLYAVHMLMVFFWLQDRSDNQHRTREMVKVLSGLVKYLKPLLALKPVSTALNDVSAILSPMFG